MLNETQEAFHVMLPHDENVNYISKINKRLFVDGIHKFGCKGSHCVEGIAGHYASAMAVPEIWR